MNNINSKDLHTERLDIRIPTLKEQHRLWEILKDEEVNKWYFPTPNRDFTNNGLSKDKVEDLIKARKIFLERLNDWDKQAPGYEKKIKSIEEQEDWAKFTWSIFLKDTDIVIGQITCQPKDEEPLDVRDVGWYIDPAYQGQKFASEAAEAVLDFMFNEVEISEIKTGAADINPASWKIMEKLGFVFTGTKPSTYLDGDKRLTSKEYYCNKNLFLNRNKSKTK